MVYLTGKPRRSLKLPFHCVRLAAGARGASSIWFGPALNIGLASRISGYLVSCARARLAHASIRDAASKLATGRRRIIRFTLLEVLGNPAIAGSRGMTADYPLRSEHSGWAGSALSSDLVTKYREAFSLR